MQNLCQWHRLERGGEAMLHDLIDYRFDLHFSMAACHCCHHVMMVAVSHPYDLFYIYVIKEEEKVDSILAYLSVTSLIGGHI